MKHLKYQLTPHDLKRIRAINDVIEDDRFHLKAAKLKAKPVPPYSPKTYPFVSCSTWMSKGKVNFPNSSSSANKEMQIWTLPDSLVQLPKAGASNALPHINIMKVIDNTNGREFPHTVDKSRLAAQISFRVKLTEESGRTDLANEPIAKHTYRIAGIDPSDISLVERIIQYCKQEQTMPFLHTAMLYASRSGEASPILHSDEWAHSFIILDELQTETTPPANSAGHHVSAEGVDFYDGFIVFLEKLWACTTSSGGNLYYYDAAEQRGLPDSAFTDGTAELRLVCLYHEAHHMTDLLNCAVIGEVVNRGNTTVFAETVPVPVQHVYQPHDSLHSMAEYYYMHPVQLAEACADVSLRQDVLLHIPHGGMYECHGDATTLQDIHLYTNIPEELIMQANPELDWSAPLPDRTLAVLPSAQRISQTGDTLRSVAESYHLELGRLAHANKDTVGLFPSNAVLNILAGPSHRISTDPIGTVSFEVQRTVPPEPNHERIETVDGQNYIRQMFHLLRQHIRENRFFNPSPYTLPLSPTEPLSIGKPKRKQKGPSIKKEDEIWTYRHTLPYYKYAKPIHGAFTPTPDAAGNPYGGIGGVLQTNYQWVDLFGNSFDSRSPRGTLYGPPVRLGYHDRLIALDQWPSVSSSYTVELEEGQPALMVILQFNPSKYTKKGPTTGTVKVCGSDLPAHRLFAHMDLRVYKRLLEQISDPFEPVSSQPQVKFYVASSLLHKPFSLDAAGCLEWLRRIHDYLKAVADEEPAPDVPLPHKASFKFLVNQIRTDNWFELKAAFRMCRDSSLVDGDFLAEKSTYETETILSPPADLHRFVAQLEAALQFDSLHIKVAKGVQPLRGETAQRQEALWAVRLNEHQAEGLGFRLLQPYCTYAPRPLITHPLPCTMSKYIYDADQGQVKEEGPPKERDINLDNGLRVMLGAVEELLTPVFAAPARFLERHKHKPEESPRFIEQLTTLKEELAGLLKTLLIPVTLTSDPSEQARAKAQGDFEQRLLQQLTHFYTMDAAVQVKADLNTISSGDQHTAKFYGALSLKQKPSTPITLTSPKLPVGQANEEDVPYLTTFMSVSQTAEGKHASLGAIDFTAEYLVTHIEHNIQSLHWNPRYRSSSWLQFVNTDQDRAPLCQQFTVSGLPLILRSYPPKPILEHACYPSIPDPDHPGDACRWTYEISIKRDDHPPQDELKVNVFFNQPITRHAFVDTGTALATELAKFTDVYPMLKQALTQNLSPLTENINTELAQKAMLALKALLFHLRSVTNYLNRYLDQTNTIEQVADKDAYHLTIREVQSRGTPNYELMLSGDRLPGQVMLLLQDENDLYEPTQTIRNDEDAEIRLIYNINREHGQKIAKRIMRLPSLHILQRQSARSTTSVVRNANIPGANTPIREEFIYRTPEVGTVTPIGLTVDYVKPIDATANLPENQSVSYYLNRLLEPLLADYNNDKAEIVVENLYTYDLENELLPIQLPIDHLLDYNMIANGQLNYHLVTDRLSQGSEAWLNKVPHSRKNGTLVFDIRMMSAVSQYPEVLLRLRDIRIPLPLGE